MRVITGSAKGKPLKALKGSATRPTSDAIKEAMFSAIQFDVEGAVVLDLFAGSGQLGIEALSRGAEFTCFADNSREAVTVIKDNLEYTKLSERARVDKLPFNAFLRMAAYTFDIAFVDPPYEAELIRKVLPALIPKMSENGIIICEHEKQLQLPEVIEDFKIDKIYKHGSVCVTILRRFNENSDLSG